MSKNNKMSKKDRELIKLINDCFNEARTESTKEEFSRVVNEVNKAKSVRSFLCLVNFGEATLSSCSGYGGDVISSIKAACSNIKEDEREKKMLWREIAKTILEVLED